MALPPLPSISSDSLRRRVFTHKSASVVQARLLKDKEELENYERLAFLGDAILGAAVAKYLFDNYPLYRIGPYTVSKRWSGKQWRLRSDIIPGYTLLLTDDEKKTQKSRLVSGIQLAEWAREYGLVSRLHCHADNRLSIENSTRVQASVFEAYLGAVYQEQGQGTINDWIGQLIQPYIDLDDETEGLEDQYGWLSPMDIDRDVEEIDQGSQLSRQTPSLHVTSQKGALAMLNEHFQKFKGGFQPEWEETSTGPEHLPHWIVKVSDPTTRKLLATGTGRRKQGAKEVAASRALEILLTTSASERYTKKRRFCLN